MQDTFGDPFPHYYTEFTSRGIRYYFTRSNKVETLIAVYPNGKITKQLTIGKNFMRQPLVTLE